MPMRIPSMVLAPASATSDLKKHLVVRDVSQCVAGVPLFFTQNRKNDIVLSRFGGYHLNDTVAREMEATMKDLVTRFWTASI